MVTAGHKAGRQDWETPAWLFDAINRLYLLNVDVCARADNAKLPIFITPEEDALKADWLAKGGRCWMNPPYGAGLIEGWVAKAHQESRRGCIVVGLLAAASGTLWWERHIKNVAQIYPLTSRVPFVGNKNGGNFDSVIVVWGVNPQDITPPRRKTTPLVVIESPLSGDVTRNVAYARACMRDSLHRGEAPYASHLLYAQEGILDDTVTLERKQGMEAGFQWGTAADLVAVYQDYGISTGMAMGIEKATHNGIPVVYRNIL